MNLKNRWHIKGGKKQITMEDCNPRVGCRKERKVFGEYVSGEMNVKRSFDKVLQKSPFGGGQYTIQEHKRRIYT